MDLFSLLIHANAGNLELESMLRGLRN